jgi:hypothetical protein
MNELEILSEESNTDEFEQSLLNLKKDKKFSFK